MESLTKLIFAETEGCVLSQFVKHVLEELHYFLPSTYAHNDLCDFIDTFTNKLNVINACQMNVKDQIFDITNLCVQHFRTTTWLAKEPALFFGSVFMDVLKRILAKSFEDKVITENITKLSVVIDFCENGEDRIITIPFRVEISNKIHISCQITAPIFFNNEIDETDIIPSNKFESIFKQSWILLSSNFKIQNFKVNTENLTLQFNLTKVTNQFKIDVRFDDKSNDVSISQASNWHFKTDMLPVEEDLECKSMSILIKKHFVFRRIHRILWYCVQVAKEKMTGKDFYLFPKLFCRKWTLMMNGRLVREEAFLHDIVDVELSNKSERKVVFEVEF